MNSFTSVRFSVLLLLLSLYPIICRGQYYFNPLISGNHPEPSICRVDKDYYIITASGSLHPALPIFYSNDLVHWSQVSSIISGSLQTWSNKLNAGTWHQPTLRFHKGVYYTLANYKEEETNKVHHYLFQNSQISGAWSTPKLLQSLENVHADASIYFESEDLAYITFSNLGEVLVQELDLNTWKVGKTVSILKSAQNLALHPRMYKKNGMYFLLTTEGSMLNTAINIYRSGSATKDFQPCAHNPIITNRQMQSSTSIGQVSVGDLVEAHNGEWWLVCQAKRIETGNEGLGFETYLAPVAWPKGEFPVVAPGIGVLANKYQIPGIANETNTLRKKEILDFTKGILPMHWVTPCRAAEFIIPLAAKETRILLQPEGLNSPFPPIYGLVADNPNFSLTVKLRFKPNTAKEEAGLCLWINKDNFFKMGIQTDGLKIAQTSQGTVTDLANTSFKFNTEQYLKIERLNYQLQFSISSDAKSWRMLHAANIKQAIENNDSETLVGLYAEAPDSESKNFLQLLSAEYISFP
jgi:alpha-N-arabinofuranosidase